METELATLRARVEILESEKSRHEQDESRPFVSLEALAQQQGISPIANVDQIFAAWPAEGDPDSLLAHVEADRKARHKQEYGKADERYSP
ncbi:MAG: hypothetical protein GKR89_22500 [Candidatus Latescibacteria bacterium]|nr:hypothetical protein [Candidatus Latescibacterota bacterium]